MNLTNELLDMESTNEEGLEVNAEKGLTKKLNGKAIAKTAVVVAGVATLATVTIVAAKKLGKKVVSFFKGKKSKKTENVEETVEVQETEVTE
jgi:uncharacterized protein (DUF697 family)